MNVTKYDILGGYVVYENTLRHLLEEERLISSISRFCLLQALRCIIRQNENAATFFDGLV